MLYLYYDHSNIDWINPAISLSALKKIIKYVFKNMQLNMHKKKYSSILHFIYFNFLILFNSLCIYLYV
jgi:hypothetical protein